MSFHVLVLIHKQLPFFNFIFYFCKRQVESLSNAGLYLHRVTQSCWLSFFLPNFFWHVVPLLLSEMCLRVCGIIKDPVGVLSHCGSNPQSEADLLRGGPIARGWLRRRWDGVLHSDEHLTSTSSQKTAKRRPVVWSHISLFCLRKCQTGARTDAAHTRSCPHSPKLMTYLIK